MKRVALALILILLTTANAHAANPCQVYQYFFPSIGVGQMPNTIGASIRGIAKTQEEYFVAEIVSIDYGAQQMQVRLGGSVLSARLSEESIAAIGTRNNPKVTPGNLILVKWQSGKLVARDLWREPERAIGNQGGSVQSATPLAAPIITTIANQGGVLYVSWNPVPGAEYYEVWSKPDAVSLPDTLIERTAACEIHHTLNQGSVSELVVDGGFESGGFSQYETYLDGSTANPRYIFISPNPPNPPSPYPTPYAGTYESIFNADAYLDGATHTLALLTKTNSPFAVAPSTTAIVSAKINWTTYGSYSPASTIVLFLRYKDTGGAWSADQTIATITLPTTPANSGGWVTMTGTYALPADAAFGSAGVVLNRNSTGAQRVVIGIDNLSCITSTTSGIPLYAVRAYRAGQFSPWSTWLQAPAQTTSLGTAQLSPTLGLLAAATADQVTTKVWSGAGSLVTLPSAGGTDLIVITDEKSSGTHGGTFTSGAWRTRDLNTKKCDTGGHASVSSNQITLAAGTYRVRISAPGYTVGLHIARLYNITDSAVLLTGTSEQSYYVAGSSAVSNRSSIAGRITLAAQKILEVQHYCNTTFVTYGFGAAAGVASTPETYTIVELEREK